MFSSGLSSMMTIFDFISVILTLAAEFDFSVTSWLRSRSRNKEIGGNAEGFHLCGLAVDAVLDTPTHKESLMKRARRLGLDAIDEGDHVHLEPKG